MACSSGVADCTTSRFGKDAAGAELLGDLSEERTLPIVLEVMECESGHDHVGGTESVDRLREVVLSNLDPIIGGESLLRPSEHGRRGVDGNHRAHHRSVLEDQGGQATVTTPKIEHRLWRLGQDLDEHAFASESRRQAANTVEILGGLRRVTPSRRHVYCL